MKGRIVTDSYAQEFRVLRNRIEGQVQAPGVLLITSATDRDGAHLTAYGLAESLGRAHQRTALVITSAPVETAGETVAGAAATALKRRASDQLEAKDATRQEGFSIITISRERLATISRTNVAGLVDELRSAHDYVVIDGGDFANNSFGLLLGASADATLVTFLVGREQVAADRAMLDMLERAEAKVLGVVMNDQSAIDRFTAHGRETTGMPAPAKRSNNPFMHRVETAIQRIGKAL